MKRKKVNYAVVGLGHIAQVAVLPGFENTRTSGSEGVLDVKIIKALNESIKSGKAVKLTTPGARRRPTLAQEIRKPPHGKPKLVRVEREAR